MTMLSLSNHNLQCTHCHCLHSAAPDQVSGVRFIPSPNENSLSVEWSRPQSDFPILYYEIRYRRHTGSHSWQGPVNATTEGVSLQSHLILSASLGVQVRAVSAIGEGLYSSEETVKCLFQHTHTHTHTRTRPRTHTTHVQMHKQYCVKVYSYLASIRM